MLSLKSLESGKSQGKQPCSSVCDGLDWEWVVYWFKPWTRNWKMNWCLETFSERCRSTLEQSARLTQRL